MSIKRYKNRKINADFIFSLRNSNQARDSHLLFLKCNDKDYIDQMYSKHLLGKTILRQYHIPSI